MSDLREFFGESATDVDRGVADPISEVSTPETPASETPSDTALRLDRWGRRRGDVIAERWASTEGTPASSPPEIADAHGALFEPDPELHPQPLDASRARWLEQFFETPEYRNLHRTCCLDSSLSELAAAELCREWERLRKEEPSAQDGDATEEPIGKTVQRIRSVAKAADAAQEAVSSAQDLAAGLGLGVDGRQLDMSELLRRSRQVRSSPALKAIMEHAGRFRRLARSLQKRKATATRGEVTGLELAGDIGRLIARELGEVAGAVPDLELLAHYRLAMRRSACYRHRAADPRGRGPIVVCVDESGSMKGDPVAAAKGLALAMAWIARQQNRWCALVGFSGGTKGTRVVLPPARPIADELTEWLVHFYGAGTTLDVPLDKLPHVYWPEFRAKGLQRGKTDVIIITDAQVSSPAKIERGYSAWAKAENVSTYVIVIGGSEPGDLEKVATKCWAIADLDLDANAVESVLSI